MTRKAKHKPLTELQLVILSKAARRDDRSALPWPRSLRSDIEVRDAAVKALVKRGLLGEEPAATKSKSWRSDAAGKGITLIVTEAGLAALALTRAEPAKPVEAKRSGTKRDAILTLLRSPADATIDDMMVVTGWQAHSIRGFISGTVAKRLGFTVRSEKLEGGERRYHVEA